MSVKELNALWWPRSHLNNSSESVKLRAIVLPNAVLHTAHVITFNACFSSTIVFRASSFFHLFSGKGWSCSFFSTRHRIKTGIEESISKSLAHDTSLPVRKTKVLTNPSHLSPRHDSLFPPHNAHHPGFWLCIDRQSGVSAEKLKFWETAETNRKWLLFLIRRKKGIATNYMEIPFFCLSSTGN